MEITTNKSGIPEIYIKIIRTVFRVLPVEWTNTLKPDGMDKLILNLYNAIKKDGEDFNYYLVDHSPQHFKWLQDTISRELEARRKSQNNALFYSELVDGIKIKLEALRYALVGIINLIIEEDTRQSRYSSEYQKMIDQLKQLDDKIIRVGYMTVEMANRREDFLRVIIKRLEEIKSIRELSGMRLAILDLQSKIDEDNRRYQQYILETSETYIRSISHMEGIKDA